MRKTLSIFLSIALIGFLFSFAGCATSRGELDIVVPEIAEPENGPRVQIVQVTDSRVFEIEPKKPSYPSLKDGEIDNKEITSRAIARKRNSWGAALGDILLPEGRTVEQLVAETIEEALEEKGYTVVEESGPDVQTMEADILKFWGWLTPGWSIPLDFQSELLLTSPVLQEDPSTTVLGSTTLVITKGAVGTKEWAGMINQGIEDLRMNIVAALKDPE